MLNFEMHSHFILVFFLSERLDDDSQTMINKINLVFKNYRFLGTRTYFTHLCFLSSDTQTDYNKDISMNRHIWLPFASQKKSHVKIQLKPRFSETETERKTNRGKKNLKYSCLQVTYLELQPPPPARGPETVALQPEASPWCLSARLDVCCWWSREVWVWVWIWDVQPTDQEPHWSRGCCHGYYFPILWYYCLHRSGWLVSDWGLWLAVY